MSEAEEFAKFCARTFLPTHSWWKSTAMFCFIAEDFNAEIEDADDICPSLTFTDGSWGFSKDGEGFVVGEDD